ncbi:MAG TPA: flagellar hook capping FlgD N-terminal domain-containing protein [Candidatus Kapabacteria bacterium]|nr:flagellar hook capping FlgD N-terminal domain-containing protein [Candidatus Kapabacteria bacterium]
MVDQVAGSSNKGQNMAASVKNNSTVGKDEFLKLLTYQLKAQNPMKPYDNQEFAAQLAQFSQLEQLVDIKSLIEEQNSVNSLLSQTISNSALPGMLGKNAMGRSDVISFSGQDSIKFSYENTYNANSGIIEIRDTAGNLINHIELSGNQLSQGLQNFEWDGRDNNGEKVANGNYKIAVSLVDSSGATYNPDTFVNGKIEAVRFKSEGTMLVINGMEIPLNKISDITTAN